MIYCRHIVSEFNNCLVQLPVQKYFPKVCCTHALDTINQFFFLLLHKALKCFVPLCFNQIVLYWYKLESNTLVQKAFHWFVKGQTCGKRPLATRNHHVLCVPMWRLISPFLKDHQAKNDQNLHFLIHGLWWDCFSHYNIICNSRENVGIFSERKDVVLEIWINNILSWLLCFQVLSKLLRVWMSHSLLQERR